MAGQSETNNDSGQAGESLATVKECAKKLDEEKALDLVVLDIGGQSSFADYFIIASVRSYGQLRGLVRSTEDFMSERGLSPKGGKKSVLEDDSWVLLDYSDVIVHIFTQEAREFYALEKLWFESPALDYKS